MENGGFTSEERRPPRKDPVLAPPVLSHATSPAARRYHQTTKPRKPNDQTTFSRSLLFVASLPAKAVRAARIEPLLGWQPCRGHFPPDPPKALLLARVPVAAPPPRRAAEISLPAPLPLHCQARARRTRFECLRVPPACRTFWRSPRPESPPLPRWQE